LLNTGLKPGFEPRFPLYSIQECKTEKAYLRIENNAPAYAGEMHLQKKIASPMEKFKDLFLCLCLNCSFRKKSQIVRAKRLLPEPFDRDKKRLLI